MLYVSHPSLDASIFLPLYFAPSNFPPLHPSTRLPFYSFILFRSLVPSYFSQLSTPSTLTFYPNLLPCSLSTLAY